MSAEMADKGLEYVKYAATPNDWEQRNRTNFKEPKITKLLRFFLLAFIIILFMVIFKQCFLPRDLGYTTIVQERVIILFGLAEPDLKGTGSEMGSKHLEDTETDKGSGEHQSCVPGSTMQQSCNTCTCTDTRVWACTRMYCAEPGKILRKDNGN